MESGRYIGQFSPEFSKLHLDSDLLWTIPPKIRRLIVIVGPRFSGTSTAVKYLASRHGIQVVRTSRLVREWARSKSIRSASRREYLSALGLIREDANDNAWVAKLALQEIRRRQLERNQLLPEDFVIDGVQHVEEVNYLRRISGVHVAYMDATSDVRLKRARSLGMIDVTRYDYGAVLDGKTDPQVLTFLDREEDDGVEGHYPGDRRGGLRDILAGVNPHSRIDQVELADVRKAFDSMIAKPC